MPPMEEDLRSQRLARMASFGGRCIIHASRRAVALHEEPPRSKNPKWYEQPETWYPVCFECHEQVQRMKREDASRLLSEALEKFPRAYLKSPD